MWFGIFREKGQQFKYVGNNRTHTPGTLWAILSVVVNRIEKLTSQTPESESQSIYSIYSNNENALHGAGLATPISPTAGYLWNDLDKKQKDSDTYNDPDMGKNKTINMYFCI